MHTSEVDHHRQYSKNTQLGFLFVLLSGIFIVTFVVFLPFLLSLFLAGVFAIAFLPLHRFLKYKVFKKDWASALVTLLLFLLIILIPVTLITFIFFEELKVIYANVLNQEGLFMQMERWQYGLTNFFLNFNLAIDFNFAQVIEQGIGTLFQSTGKIFSQLAYASIYLLIFLFALFYILVNVERVKRFVLNIIPMNRVYAMRILNQGRESILGVMQELLFLFVMRFAGLILLFLIFNLPNPFFWSLLGALVSIVPGIGMIIAVIPASVYFILSGQVFAGLLLFALGIFLVILIENILAPKLIQNKIGAHPFLILLATIGGLIVFGPVGFFIGPIFLSLAVVLFKEFPKIYNGITKESL